MIRYVCLAWFLMAVATTTVAANSEPSEPTAVTENISGCFVGPDERN
jgi:hypothetical protein